MVMPLLKLWVMLQADDSAAYKMLGWAYLVQGEKELAAGNMRRALGLDPENERAETWLQQLRG